MKKQLLSGLFIILSLFLVACNTDTSQGGSNGNSNESSNGANGSANGEVINLTYAFFATENTYPGIVATYWAEELEKRSNGRVNVDLYYSGTLLDASNMLDGVGTKVADIGLTAISYETGRFPLVDLNDLPNNYGNAVTASKVVNTLLEEYPYKDLENYQVLKTFATEPMYFQTTKKVDSLESLKGLELRASSSSLVTLLDKLGAVGVGMSQAEQLQSLQTGIIHGTVTERGQLTSAQLQEYVDYVTDYQLGITTLVAFMNKDTWNSLPEDIQQIIIDLKAEIPEYAGNVMDDQASSALAEAQSKYGVEVVPLSEDEKAKLDAIVEDVRDHYINAANDKGLPGTEYAERLKELVEEYSN